MGIYYINYKEEIYQDSARNRNTTEKNSSILLIMKLQNYQNTARHIKLKIKTSIQVFIFQIPKLMLLNYNYGYFKKRKL
jgi:hypothetical protein